MFVHLAIFSNKGIPGATFAISVFLMVQSVRRSHKNVRRHASIGVMSAQAQTLEWPEHLVSFGTRWSSCSSRGVGALSTCRAVRPVNTNPENACSASATENFFFVSVQT